MSELLNVLIMAIVAGGALYLLNLAPIDATIKRVVTVLVLIVAVIWALKWLIGYAGGR